MTDLTTFAYGDLRGVYSEADASLGGNVDAGDPYTHAPAVWDYLVHRFAVRSVLDVGCGQGHAAAYFFRQHGCAVIAIDGLADNLAHAVHPLIIHDLRAGPFRTRVDLVHCAETVEHIRPEFVPNVMATLTCGRVVMLTAAAPEQAGYHHVNCQPSEYWIGLMKDHGFTHSSIDTRRIRALADRDGAVWFRETGLVFIRT
jgi:SAM-dependent methyltransferase